jgi:hypothetical protein
MVVTDGLAEGTRSTMHHQPEAGSLVSLDFDEMVSASKCCELDHAFIPADGFKTRLAEAAAGDSLRLLDDRPSIAAPSRHRPANICEDLPGNLGNVQGCSLNVQGHSQHSTSYVAPDCLWIDKM